MPRLDNSSGYVIGYFYLTENFNPDDPGDNPPIDLCAHCWMKWIDTPYEIDHPSYADSDYYCFECRDLLTEADDVY